MAKIEFIWSFRFSPVRGTVFDGKVKVTAENDKNVLSMDINNFYNRTPWGSDPQPRVAFTTNREEFPITLTIELFDDNVTSSYYYVFTGENTKKRIVNLAVFPTYASFMASYTGGYYDIQVVSVETFDGGRFRFDGGEWQTSKDTLNVNWSLFAKEHILQDFYTNYIKWNLDDVTFPFRPELTKMRIKFDIKNGNDTSLYHYTYLLPYKESFLKFNVQEVLQLAYPNGSISWIEKFLEFNESRITITLDAYTTYKGEEITSDAIKFEMDGFNNFLEAFLMGKKSDESAFTNISSYYIDNVCRSPYGSTLTLVERDPYIDELQPIEEEEPTEGDYLPSPDDDDTTLDESTVSLSNPSDRYLFLHSADVKQLFEFLWSSNFIDDIHLLQENPIENIISLKQYPISPSLKSGNGVVKIGNVNTGVSCRVLNRVFTKNSVNIGIETHFNNFLDYEPYTKISLYLPFYGRIELKPSNVVGKILKVEYIIDYTTGILRYNLYVGNQFITSVECNCSIEIPLAASNNSQYLASIGSGLLQAAVGVIEKDFLGVAYGIGNALTSQRDYDMKGNPTPLASMVSKKNFQVIYDRPIANIPTNFAHSSGYASNCTKRISDITGYTVIENYDTTGINALEKEREELKQILESGFYA